MQPSQNNKFDQQVKDILENASVEPPAFLWNTIENKLPANTTWYSKYKYLLLLLLLVCTSSTSIFVYKHIVLKKNSSEIALNKRLLKDEMGESIQIEKPNNGKKGTLLFKKNNQVAQTTDLKKTENISGNNNGQSSVSSFYKTDKSDVKNETILKAEKIAKEQAKRAARLKRLEVQPQKQQVAEAKNINEPENNNAPNAVIVVASTNISGKKVKNKNTQKDKLMAGNATLVTRILPDIEQRIQSKDSPAEVTENAELNTAAESSAVEPSVAVEEDITRPITEPIHGTDAEPLTASVTPVKIYHTPIPARDVLRSMIEPEKLEKLDIESQAAGITDLNPNKEKFLKNLKQFAGYDINKGFHIGAFIAINNVWLNKKEFSADENTTSIKPKLQIRKAYGINIGYDYTDRWGIELEWQISEQGQKYSMKQQTVDHVCIKDVNLLYTKFPLMLKYKQTFINNYNSKPIALSLLFGPQFGFLLKENVMMDGKELKETPGYNKIEFGILGGFDFDLFMTRNLALTIGGRTGFASSFKKGQPMSFQLGITTQLNFRFPKKIK